MSAHIKTLAESGALRQFKHNDGSEGFVFAYDKEVTDRYIAALAQRTAGGIAEVVERDGERLIVWNIEDPDDFPVGTQLYAAQPVAEAAAQAVDGACSVCSGKDVHCSHCDGMGIEPRKLIGYGDCKCVLSQYCDGKCNPIYSAPKDASAQADEFQEKSDWSYAVRGELAQAFFAPYIDANGENLLDYPAQPAIRRLAAAILEWQSLDKPAAAPTAQPTLPDDMASLHAIIDANRPVR